MERLDNSNVDAEYSTLVDEEEDYSLEETPGDSSVRDPMAGIGYWEAPGNSPRADICALVRSSIDIFKNDILMRKHTFPVEVLVDAVQGELPTEDEDAIRGEIEIQIFRLLIQDADKEPQPSAALSSAAQDARTAPQGASVSTRKENSRHQKRGHESQLEKQRDTADRSKGVGNGVQGNVM